MNGTNEPKSPMAGGCLLAATTVLGAVIGFFEGQPTIGMLIGLGAGVALSVAVWLVDRQRRG
ncbi:MAG: hypothetical protein ACOY45_06075 [Pseudomonadota bacterium]